MTIEEKKPFDYVYMGESGAGKNKRCDFGVIEDNKITKSLSLPYSRASSRRIGGIYRGAKFDEAFTTLSGFDNAVYVGRWHDESAITMWQSLQEKMLFESKTAAIEKNETTMNLINTSLKELRVMHANMGFRGDERGRMALEHAVLLALRTKPKHNEK